MCPPFSDQIAVDDLRDARRPIVGNSPAVDGVGSCRDASTRCIVADKGQNRTWSFTTIERLPWVRR